MFTVPDGTTWLQTDDREVSGTVRPGTEVTIEHGAFNGYFATLKGRPGFRVRRVN